MADCVAVVKRDCLHADSITTRNVARQRCGRVTGVGAVPAGTWGRYEATLERLHHLYQVIEDIPPHRLNSVLGVQTDSGTSDSCHLALVPHTAGLSAWSILQILTAVRCGPRWKRRFAQAAPPTCKAGGRCLGGGSPARPAGRVWPLARHGSMHMPLWHSLAALLVNGRCPAGGCLSAHPGRPPPATQSLCWLVRATRCT